MVNVSINTLLGTFQYSINIHKSFIFGINLVFIFTPHKSSNLSVTTIHTIIPAENNNCLLLKPPNYLIDTIFPNDRYDFAKGKKRLSNHCLSCFPIDEVR